MPFMTDTKSLLAEIKDCIQECEKRLEREKASLRAVKDETLKHILTRRVEDQKKLIERHRKDAKEMEAHIQSAR